MTDDIPSSSGGPIPARKTSRYIDPLSDFGFKRLFGEEPNKEIMIDFLNSLFEGEKKITDLEYSPTEYSGDTKELKKVVFDLVCTGKNQEKFIIEMQRSRQQFFRDRAVFYTSRLINQQLPRGRTHWNTGLKEVYLIGILEFVFEDSPAGDYLHDVALTNINTGAVFYDKLWYKFLELPRFVKREEELVTQSDKWIYLLKHLSHLKKIPAALNKGIFQKVFKIAEVSKLTKEEKSMYDVRRMDKWDYENTIAYAEDMGIEKGEHKKAIEAATILKGEGIAMNIITKATKLTIQEIEAL